MYLGDKELFWGKRSVDGKRSWQSEKGSLKGASAAS